MIVGLRGNAAKIGSVNELSWHGLEVKQFKLSLVVDLVHWHVIEFSQMKTQWQISVFKLHRILPMIYLVWWWVIAFEYVQNVMELMNCVYIVQVYYVLALGEEKRNKKCYILWLFYGTVRWDRVYHFLKKLIFLFYLYFYIESTEVEIFRRSFPDSCHASHRYWSSSNFFIFINLFFYLS